MSGAAGYILYLNNERKAVFDSIHTEHGFAEPVSEFSHSRNSPLLCFIFDTPGNVTHLALGKRGRLAGTGMRRLNLEQIFSLNVPVSSSVILQAIRTFMWTRANKRLIEGGLLSPKIFEELIRVISKLAPETAPVLARFSQDRKLRIEKLSTKSKIVLAEQKEAVATALTIAGINRDELLGWDTKTDGSDTSSFLDGLPQIRLREDPIVVNDLMNLPGFDILKSTPHSSVVFENDQSRLTVVLANRLPLEQLTGADLIYFNETFSCFIMVQYKAMESEAGETVYRFPNEQLTTEVNRMKEILAELNKCNPNTEADGYRLSENPFFLKICPRIVFTPDNVGLVTGMYLPLDYWELLAEHPTLAGPNGGKRISYRNARRYFDNTAFVTIASGGWVGTTISQSSILQLAIRSTLETGRAVVFAVNAEKDDRHRLSNDGIPLPR